MDYKVIHNTEENRFEAKSDEGLIGLIDYHYTRDQKAMMVTHTEVNPEYEGRGIAGEMTKVLLEYAKENQLKILPICSYTRVYMERYTEYQDLLNRTNRE